VINAVNEALRRQPKKHRVLGNVENPPPPAENDNQQLYYEELNFDQI
jgi:hypothetical protein